MLDLLRMALEADSLADQVRNARCCDALKPCTRCWALRRGVLARRLVISDHAAAKEEQTGLAPVLCLTDRMAS